MKCVRLSTLGVGFGSIVVIGFTITIIYIIKVLCDFGNLSDEDKKGNEDVWSSTITTLYIILVVCLVAITISALLIAGIVKKRHSLMRPWLICAFLGIVFHGLRMIIGFFGGLIYQPTLGEVLWGIFESIFTLALEIWIFFTMYKLYKEIRDEKFAPSAPEPEVIGMHRLNEDPPSYADLERNGQLNQ